VLSALTIELKQSNVGAPKPLEDVEYRTGTWH
jgi:hypothetical protein